MSDAVRLRGRAVRMVTFSSVSVVPAAKDGAAFEFDVFILARRGEERDARGGDGDGF